MLKQAKLNKISTALRTSKINKGAIALTALASLFVAPAYSEEATVEDQVEVIEVKGIRGTVTRSINEKKNTAAIVDAIAAADFGELPGLSLSDIIENIPGATGHRLKGSQNEISIRGLGSNLGYSTLNGRTITTAGPGRAVNFKKFPSDLVDKVVVYKTQQADLVEGGTSGTIEVSSLRAVDYGKTQTVVEVTGIYNDYYSNVEATGVTPFGNKVVFSTVHSWETENLGDLGFTFGYVETNDSNPEEVFTGSSRQGVCGLRDNNGVELPDNGTNCAENRIGRTANEQAVFSGEVGRGPTLDGTELDGFDIDSVFFAPSDSLFRSVEDTDTRTNVVFTAQWVPNDEWDINLDYEYSKLFYDERRLEAGIDNRQSDLVNHIIADDNTLSYVEGTSRIDFNSETRTQLDEYDGGGIEVAYTPTDELTLSVDLSYSKSYRERIRQRTNFRTGEEYDYTFDARDSTVPEVVFFQDGVTDDVANDRLDLTDLSDFLVGVNGIDSDVRLEYRRDNDERTDDVLAVRFDADYVLDHDIFSSVSAGIRYSREHLIDLQDNEVALALDGSELQRSLQFTDNDVATSIATNCQTSHDNSELFADGGGIGEFATFDASCFIGEVLDVTTNVEARRAAVGNTDTEGFFDIGGREDSRSGDDVDAREDILAIYAIAHIDTEVNDKPLTGNIGLRFVRTENSASGFTETLALTTNDDGTFNYDVSQLQPTTVSDHYTTVLPSVNLTYQVSDEFFVKASASKSISRFQLNAFAAGFDIDECDGVRTTADDATDDDTSDSTSCIVAENTDPNIAIESAEQNGNFLDPFESTNYDLSFEYYPSQDAAVTLGLYWKNFTGGSTSVTSDEDIDITVDGAVFTIEDVPTTFNQTDPRTSTIKGFEFTANKNFSTLPAPFNGLGVNVAFNHAISDFETPELATPGIGNLANLFGFSENVASSSIYWEGDALSLRLLYKYRSTYLQPNGLPFPDRTSRFVQDSEYVDFSAKYKLTKNISVSLKALNLFDEPQVFTRGNDTSIAEVSRSGRKFFLGVKAKF